MVQRTPRDEREWRSMVEHGIREARQGIRPLIAAAIGTVTDTIEETNTRRPTHPIELTYQTALYLDSYGRQRVRFMLDFPDVTKATDGTDITVESYELWGLPDLTVLLDQTTDAVAGLAAPGLTIPGLAATEANMEIGTSGNPWSLRATSAESAFRSDGYLPRSLWRFRARAIGLNTATPGEWSDEITVQMLMDTVPPPQPTAPVLTVQRGTITATWDGQAVTGAMPADFKYAILAHGTDTSPTFEIARFGRNGGFKVVANIPYYDPQFFRLQAVDESGNKSPWSEQAVGYTEPLVDADIILSTIDGATTYLKNIDAGVSILPNTIITQHLVVTEEMTAAIANFLHVRADMLEANEIWADAAWFGVADAILVRSDMFEGKAFMGGTFTGMLFQTDIEALTGIKMDSTGIVAWNPGGELTFQLSALTGDVDILGTFQIGRIDEPYVLLTKDAWSIWPGIRFKVQDPDLDYQPTMFAVGSETELSNLELGDLMVMGGQDVANTSPRGELKIGGRGTDIHLGRYWTDNGISNQIRFYEDGGTGIFGYLKTDNAGGSFRTSDTPQTNIAAGTFTVPVVPPVSGLYSPAPIPDGIAPVSFATRSITASGYEIVFSGPADNLTSFRSLCAWRP
jgi:hypothetical protein